MKRKIILTTMAVMILVGCGSDNHEVENQVVQDAETKIEAKEEIVVNSGEVTKEKLMIMDANPASDFKVYLDEEENEYVITDYLGEGEVVVIPDSIEGIPVGIIKRMAFANNNRGGTSIKAVRLPDTVHTIGENAFGNCSDLELFLPGSGLRVIQEGTFLGCENLNQFDIPEGIQIIEFGGIPNNNKWDNVYYPSSITYLEAYSDNTTVIVEEGSYVDQVFREIVENSPSLDKEIIYK